MFQTVFIASFNCANTPDALTSNTMNPMMAIVPFFPLVLAPLIICWMADAASAPRAPVSCSLIAPRAAFSPKMVPAIEMATISSGAMEKTE